MCPTFCDPWTVVGQAPPSKGFSRQEHWSGLPFPSPGSLPEPGIEPGSPALQADSLPSESPGNYNLEKLIKKKKKNIFRIILTFHILVIQTLGMSLKANI